MSSDMLFEGADQPASGVRATSVEGAARFTRADRAQSLLSATTFDELVPQDHRARSFWELLGQLDLSPFAAKVRSREGQAGRPAMDPRVLLCLWLYAISEGIGSARHVARLCERDAPYRWICGGLEPSAHTLSDFRVDHGSALDELLKDLLASLSRSGVVTLSRVAQDGVRVRARAGAASFRRKDALESCRELADQLVEQTKRDLDGPAREESRVKLAAAARAARDRQQRVAEAQAQLARMQERREHEAAKKAKKAEKAAKREKSKARLEVDAKNGEPRASTSDPEARRMRMADGGYRPGFNVQAAVDTESRIVVAVSVCNDGNDVNQMVPMLEQIERNVGKLPQQHLVDGGYVKKSAIDVAHERGVEVFAPQHENRTGDPSKPRWDDGAGTKEWRARMSSEGSAEIYKERAATIETTFGDWRQWRGLKQMPVRGLAKGLCVTLLTALSYNLIRVMALGVPI